LVKALAHKTQHGWDLAADRRVSRSGQRRLGRSRADAEWLLSAAL